MLPLRAAESHSALESMNWIPEERSLASRAASTHWEPALPEPLHQHHQHLFPPALMKMLCFLRNSQPDNHIILHLTGFGQPSSQKNPWMRQQDYSLSGCTLCLSQSVANTRSEAARLFTWLPVLYKTEKSHWTDHETVLQYEILYVLFLLLFVITYDQNISTSV